MIAGVRLPERSGGGQLLYVDTGDLQISAGEWLVIDGPDGVRLGQVVIAPHQLLKSAPLEPAGIVLGRARADERQSSAFERAGQRLLQTLDLPA